MLTCNVDVDSCLLESHSSWLAGREPEDGEGGGGGGTEEQQQTHQQGQADHPPPPSEGSLSVSGCSSEDGHCRTDRGCSMFDIVRPRLQLIHITQFSSIMKSNLSVWERLARSCSFLDERVEIIVDGGRKILFSHVRHQLTAFQGFSLELPTLIG